MRCQICKELDPALILFDLNREFCCVRCHFKCVLTRSVFQASLRINSLEKGVPCSCDQCLTSITIPFWTYIESARFASPSRLSGRQINASCWAEAETNVRRCRLQTTDWPLKIDDVVGAEPSLPVRPRSPHSSSLSRHTGSGAGATIDPIL